MISQWIQSSPDTQIHISASSPSQNNKPPSSSSDTTTIIFLHYWGGSHRTWSKVIPRISSSSEYPWVAIDFRGWGDSTGPEDEHSYSMDRLASDVEAVIASLLTPRSSSGHNDVILVGLSMGAKVAQLVAGRWMEEKLLASSSSSTNAPRLRGIVLVSPAPPTPFALPTDEMREQQLHAYDDAESARFAARNVLTTSGDDDDIEVLAEDMLRGNPWARAAWPSYGMGEDITDAARNIACPVLVVAAGKDVVEPVEKVEREVWDVIVKGGNSSYSEMVVLEGSGHLSPMDRPGELSEAIVGFVKRVTG